MAEEGAEDQVAAIIGQLFDDFRAAPDTPVTVILEAERFYTDALAKLIADETGASGGDPRPYVVANALIGVHRSLIAQQKNRN